ncbi:MAG: hypothetical protein J3R72DRAFT_453760 [Linnemannia gamsii]|nr:MAG: hypothetical protein J3R72DRAFT_453760 [Linnemannia gamsii]
MIMRRQSPKLRHFLPSLLRIHRFTRKNSKKKRATFFVSFPSSSFLLFSFASALFTQTHAVSLCLFFPSRTHHSQPLSGSTISPEIFDNTPVKQYTFPFKKPCQSIQMRRPFKAINSNKVTLNSRVTLNNKVTLSSNKSHTVNNLNNNITPSLLPRPEGPLTQELSPDHQQSSWIPRCLDPTISFHSTRPSSSSVRLLPPCHPVLVEGIMNCGLVSTSLLPFGVLCLRHTIEVCFLVV